MKKIIFAFLLILSISIPLSTQAAFLDCGEEDIIAEVKINKTECTGECKNYRVTARNINVMKSNSKSGNQSAAGIVNDFCQDNSSCSVIRVDYFPVCRNDTVINLFISKDGTSSEPVEATTVQLPRPLSAATLNIEKKIDQNIFSFEINVVPQSWLVRTVNYVKREVELFVVGGVGVVVGVGIMVSLLLKKKTSKAEPSNV